MFLSFESFDQSRTGAEAEALSVTQQVETAQFLPSTATGELSAELTCYARYVVGVEWPQMEASELQNQVNPWGVAMFKTLQGVQPESASEQAAYSKWLDQTSDRESARLDRVHGAEGVLPWILWVALILTAVIIFTYMLFFADSGEPAWLQGIQIGSVVAVMAILLLLINYLDHPYRAGPGGLQPTAMERTISVVEGELAGVGNHGTVPCDASGQAL